MKLLILLLFSFTAQAVQINDTLHTPDGNLVSGRIIITLSTGTSSTTATFAAFRREIRVNRGVVSVDLAANNTLTPSGSQYRVEYRIDNGLTPPQVEFWSVPTGGPYTIRQVRVNPSLPNGTIALGMLPSTGALLGDLLVYGSSGWQHINAGTNDYCLKADSTQTAGVKYAACAGAGTSVDSLAGLTGALTLPTPGTSGTAPNWSPSGTAITLNIPLASATSVTAGLLSKTKYDQFDSKLGSADIGSLVQAFDADLATIAAFAKTDLHIMMANGTAWITTALVDCDNPTTSKLLFDETTRAFTCGTDQGGGGGMTDPMTTRGDLIYRNAANATARLPIGTGFLKADGTDVSGWATLVDGDIPAAIARDSEVSAGYQPLDTDLTALAAISGTRGDLIRRGASAWERVALGSSTRVIKSDGTDAVWGQVAFSELSGAATDAQIPDDITLTNITQITNRAVSDTTGNLAASRVDDGGAAATQALFSGAAGSAGFRAIVAGDLPDLSAVYQPLDTELTQIAAITRTRGNLIVGGASAWQALTIGVANRFLISDGTDAAWTALSSSHITTALGYTPASSDPRVAITSGTTASYSGGYVRCGITPVLTSAIATITLASGTAGTVYVGIDGENACGIIIARGSSLDVSGTGFTESTATDFTAMQHVEPVAAITVSGGAFTSVANYAAMIRTHSIVEGDGTDCTLTVDGLQECGVDSTVIRKGTTQVFSVKIWGTGASSVLQDTDDEASIWNNQTGGPVTINSLTCESDTGTPTVQLQKDDGSVTNMLSSNLTCATTPATTSTFVSGENVLATGNRLDHLTVSAGGSAHWVTLTIAYTRN